MSAITDPLVVDLVTYKCPSCGTKLAPLEPMDHATSVVSRTCRKCGDRWQVISEMVINRSGVRADKGTLTFLDTRFIRRRLAAEGR